MNLRAVVVAIFLGITVIACAAPMPSPTPTIEPTSSPTPIPAPSPTPTAAPSPTPSRPAAEVAAPECATREIQGDGRIGQVVYRQDGIWLLDLDTGERTAFAEGEQYLEPVPSDWSPDGKWRAFARGDGSLWVESANGQQRREILQAGSGVRGSIDWMVSPVHWSPDGERIAYLVAQGKDALGPPTYLGIWRIRPDGSEPTEIYVPSDAFVEQPELMGWSPDGQVILFRKGMYHSASFRADGLEIHAVPSEGGEPRILGTTLLYPDFLAWSPGGDCVALTDGGGREVWLNKQIVVAASDRLARAKLSNDPRQADVQPSWSPDGKKIAYVSRLPDTHPLMTEAIYETDIWIMDADGTGKRQLTFTESAGEHRPLWSPDGEHILFVRMENNRMGLWIMGADGSAERQVAELGAVPLPPSNYYGHIDLTGLYAWYPKGG